MSDTLNPLTAVEIAEMKAAVEEFLAEDAQANADPDRSTIQKSTTRISYEYLGRILATLEQDRSELTKLKAAAGEMERALDALDKSWLDVFAHGPDHDYGGVSMGDEHKEIWRQIRAALLSYRALKG